MKKIALILAVIVMCVGCASTPLNAPQSTLNTVKSAENVYNIERPVPNPLFVGRVSIVIAENGHLVVYDDTGIVVDLDDTAFLFIKMRNIMRSNIEKAGKSDE